MTETASPAMYARLVAEALGTFVLVLGGCGTALLAANFPDAEVNTLGVGFLGVALAFGLTVVVGAFALGPISGGHFNPAVTLGLAAAGRFSWGDVGGYIVAQLVGGVVASSVLALVVSGGPDGFFDAARESGFASNGFGEHSPGGFGLGSAIVVETVLTAVFLFVILGTTARVASPGFAPLAIGLTLTLIHLISIPVTNTSVNPARSLATAVYGGGWAMGQLWVFIVFPILGALIAGLAYRPMFGRVLTE
ncbi:aquaporin Z [Promicromonospora sp. AC04]|uniref:aquaporin Z n=1 Tax=Promicromonospora sp. AC04 TaxID=2135723 RepID=UPI000D44F890|nr:aquaporin Z [Promicromonospora sp. AC04]PUB30204.1 aquaporin Z [Promicromonospora sp. AC04]